MTENEANNERKIHGTHSSGVAGADQQPKIVAEATDICPFEGAKLISLIGRIDQRLSRFENRESNPYSDESKSEVWLESLRIIFGGWTVFGLIFLILFYQPLRDSINTIPENLRRVHEMSLSGLTLKMAEKAGKPDLAKTLPTLTRAAVEFMLRGSKNYNDLTKIDATEGAVVIMWLPSEGVLRVLEELESKNLLVAQLNYQKSSVKELRKSINEIKNKNPAKNEEFTSIYNYWELVEPKKIEVPAFGWRLTELGAAAVEIIIQAVADQLTEVPGRERK